MSPIAFGWYRGATLRVSAALLALCLIAAVLVPARQASATAEAAEEVAAQASDSGDELLYTKLYPDFIVNLRGSGSHFLMVTTQIRTRLQSDIDNALLHLPALRHNLLMLMGEISYRDALSVEGRQKLADDALAAIQRVLDEEVGGSEVEAVLFTDYLVE